MVSKSCVPRISLWVRDKCKMLLEHSRMLLWTNSSVRTSITTIKARARDSLTLIRAKILKDRVALITRLLNASSLIARGDVLTRKDAALHTVTRSWEQTLVCSPSNTSSSSLATSCLCLWLLKWLCIKTRCQIWWSTLRLKLSSILPNNNKCSWWLPTPTWWWEWLILTKLLWCNLRVCCHLNTKLWWCNSSLYLLIRWTHLVWRSRALLLIWLIHHSNSNLLPLNCNKWLLQTISYSNKLPRTNRIFRIHPTWWIMKLPTRIPLLSFEQQKWYMRYERQFRNPWKCPDYHVPVIDNYINLSWDDWFWR